MAFNPYYPATYQPVYYQQPYQQPQQTGIIWVSSDAEAEAYPIAPNNAVRLWHSSLPVVYFKSADASGKPTIKAYDLVERTGSTDTKTVEYATKDELAQISQEIEAIKAEFKKPKRKRREEDDYDFDDE